MVQDMGGKANAFFSTGTVLVEVTGNTWASPDPVRLQENLPGPYPIPISQVRHSTYTQKDKYCVLSNDKSVHSQPELTKTPKGYQFSYISDILEQNYFFYHYIFSVSLHGVYGFTLYSVNGNYWVGFVICIVTTNYCKLFPKGGSSLCTVG